MDRNLALEVVRVTEAAALACGRFVGLGYRDGADRAATEAMRRTFGYMHIRGRIVIGDEYAFAHAPVAAVDGMPSELAALFVLGPMGCCPARLQKIG